MEQGIKVSLFASAVRQKLWFSLLDSLNSTSVPYEVIFAGNAKYWQTGVLMNKANFKYIETGNIKPSQCYEIARRACSGDVVVWIADDCEFKWDIIGKAFQYWNGIGNDKLILSLQTEESGIWQNMDHHRLFGGGNTQFPLMAPIGMMSRKFLEDLGGLDRRYICGQYENDIVMRACAVGGSVEVYGDRGTYVEINHHEKSVLAGEITTKQEFEKRPFATGYGIDRMILEKSYCKMNEAKLFAALTYHPNEVYTKDYMDMLPGRTDVFEPYGTNISFTDSESHKGIWD